MTRRWPNKSQSQLNALHAGRKKNWIILLETDSRHDGFVPDSNDDIAARTPLPLITNMNMNAHLKVTMMPCPSSLMSMMPSFIMI